ncbi:hypothetical protein [Acidovorax sp. NCPPB 4044]|uniref:hypothetical protein n=1 Tax=Acidovorax sp. NCPPB 4044 TaxID=2940490 RepID=UPI002303BFDC|nr:hypothetical protein [Acidovorax sp. NCPPB 4044]MDA8522547.1 hypothetical protein [Acidovorax sp. NCPPB 4044]
MQRVSIRTPFPPAHGGPSANGPAQGTPQGPHRTSHRMDAGQADRLRRPTMPPHAGMHGTPAETIDRHSRLPPRFQSPAASGRVPSWQTFGAQASAAPGRPSALNGARLQAAREAARLLMKKLIANPDFTRQAAQQMQEVSSGLMKFVNTFPSLSPQFASRIRTMSALFEKAAANFQRLSEQHSASQAPPSSGPAPAAQTAAAPEAAPPEAPEAPTPEAAPEVPPQAAAAEAAPAEAAAAAPPHAPVDVMDPDTDKARKQLVDGFGGGKAAEQGMREIALDFKKALGSVDGRIAFQQQYKDRLALPDDFAQNNKAIIQLKRVLGDAMRVSYVDPSYGKDTGIGSEDFNARRSSQAAPAA